jgi:hypothetical protein
MPASTAAQEARLTSAQYAALAKLEVRSRVVGSSDGDPIILTPRGFRIALEPDGRWRILARPDRAPYGLTSCGKRT